MSAPAFVTESKGAELAASAVTDVASTSRGKDFAMTAKIPCDSV
jgi:hypothetical protein